MIRHDNPLIRQPAPIRVIPADAGTQWHAKCAVAGIRLDSIGSVTPDPDPGPE
jgi:hypothetical protein